MSPLGVTPTSAARQAIVRYLIDNVDHPSVSISEVLHAVREVLPLCELTDWELADHIARSASDAGIIVEFDANMP
ncbi:hypothetical protein FJ492_24015 [Mesorhizobium sp. B2-5-4]|nr:hypothetical protein FJ434_19990 [Mesorhizobium sp. B2-5-13]TPK38290.1 hypothetical protein FJ492_24015 [Mesorhizobium sp. B2-5-4]TPK44463.1 hypothetical protein FJ560_23080 [Mesorhizobium sp. B2-5-5]